MIHLSCTRCVLYCVMQKTDYASTERTPVWSLYCPVLYLTQVIVRLSHQILHWCLSCATRTLEATSNIQIPCQHLPLHNSMVHSAGEVASALEMLCIFLSKLAELLMPLGSWGRIKPPLIQRSSIPTLTLASSSAVTVYHTPFSPEGSKQQHDLQSSVFLSLLRLLYHF